ncbi:DUF6346 domain-containing protein [Micromonospora sp. LAH09]|uniref:DUF6346 domain-containing protein n=1 Tax=Micromonospora cabrerizensis TaxID=2911213 RepID=UPI001EE89DF8|nr:DUF6346 domain-containing protein [Micromonospora cabrerizensis]MCG5467306.1 DUF6346 domain-containing protein [Micromonospora cabrerizensis]
MALNDGDVDQTGRVQGEQIAAYERRGPFWGRLTQFAVVVVCAASLVASTLVLDTVVSFYPGTGAYKSTPAQQQAEATVHECRRVGPVSGDGFGYWWHCAVTVRTSDGREVRTVVRHSTVTPHDRGSPVEFREVCYGKGNTDCRYGRPAWRIWALALAALGIMRTALVLLLLLGTGLYLLRTVVGVPRYYAWVNRRAKGRRSVSRRGG